MSGHEHADERVRLGAALAQAREARGLSAGDVAAAINLRETVVRAIERDDFTLCGGHVYARGHLRAYARQVGLDAGPLLAQYAELSGEPAAMTASMARSAPVTASAAAAPHGRDGAHPAGDGPADGRDGPATMPPLSPPARTWLSRDVPLERTGPNWALIAGAALAALLVLLAVQLVGDLRAPGRGTSEVASPATSTPSSTPEPTSPQSSGAATTPPSRPTPSSTPSATPAPSPDGVAVAMRFTGDSWVSVRDASGRTMFSGLLGKGDLKRFEDGKGLRLTLGNAGAVQLTVNGRSIGSAGGPGQVVRLSFGPHDPA